MTGEKWIIYWGEYGSDTYLYGSSVRFHGKRDVEFANAGMPSGTVIRRWYSKTNYQMQKIEPALPMIDGEGVYEITVDIDYLPGENCLVRLVFYDKYGEEAGALSLRDKSTHFRCPLKTYSYCMELVNGGVSHFHFHSIVIQEILDEEE